MKLHCINSNEECPSLHLHFRGVSLLFDCPVDFARILPVSPMQSSPASLQPAETNAKTIDAASAFEKSRLALHVPIFARVDPAEIRAVFLSHWSSLLALPYLTEYSGFRGEIYATEPTLQYGRMAMEELVHQFRACQRENEERPFIKEKVDGGWREVYSNLDVAKCVSKIQSLSYNEEVKILSKFTVTPVSSGYLLGSCNWLIKTDYEKISILSSSSSTRNRYPLPFNYSLISKSDVTIAYGLNREPHRTLNGMIEQFCSLINETLPNGGNVLLPTNSCGLALDLIEILSNLIGQRSFPQKAFSNMEIFSENGKPNHIGAIALLAPVKRDRIYLPGPPFYYKELIKQGILECVPEINPKFASKMKEPCIVITGHPSLRFGDVVHFLNMWKNRRENTLIMTDSDYDFHAAISAHQPINMKAVYCPIDTRVSFVEMSSLIQKIDTADIFVPQSYLDQSLGPHRSFVPSSKMKGFSAHVGLSIPLKRKYERAFVAPKLAQSVELESISESESIGTVRGVLKIKHSQFHIEPTQPTVQHPSEKSDGSYSYGKLTVSAVAQYLNKECVQYKIENQMSDGEASIIIRDWHAEIRIHPTNPTHIECHTSFSNLVECQKLIQSLLSSSLAQHTKSQSE